jgi:hypothetical protein
MNTKFGSGYHKGKGHVGDPSVERKIIIIIIIIKWTKGIDIWRLPFKVPGF